MTILADNHRESLPPLSTTELDPSEGAPHDQLRNSSRGTFISHLREVDWLHRPMPESAVRMTQDQAQSDARVPVHVPLSLPTGSTLEPAIMEMTSTVESRLSSRTSEERRRQTEHSAFIGELFKVQDELPGVPQSEHAVFMQISTQLLCQLSSSQTRSRREAP